MIFLIYMILVILQCKGIKTQVSDPCPSSVVESTVADMCSSSSATENVEHSGSFQVDSVVLRIMIQQDNCICRVTIDNQIEPLSVGLRKYEGRPLSAPTKYVCGLAVDINRIHDMSTLNEIDPIKCVVDSDPRNIALLQNTYLQFESRIINGNFTRGYCMRIRRGINSNHSQVLRIECDAPTTPQQTTESVKSTTHISNIDSTTTVTTTNVKHQQINITTDTTTGIEQTIYIAIGAGSGVALILLVVLVVICLRRKSTQKPGTNGNVDDSHQQEESDDKLPYNMLYVPAGEFDINSSKCSTADVDTARSSNTRLSMEGNYSTVDEDMPNSSNKRFSIEGDCSTVDEDTRKSPNERLSVEGNYNTVDEDTRKCPNERLSMEDNYSTVDEDTRTSPNERLSMEDNYSTVDEDTRKSPNERLSVEGNYSTVDDDMPQSPNERLSVDGNYSTVKIDEHLQRNCSYPENSERGETKRKQKPTLKPKPKSSCITSEDNRSTDPSIKHISPPNDSDNVYAVVDKTSKNAPTTSGSKGEGTCQSDQTYAVVDKARKRKSNPDETNKKKFEINSGNK